MTHVFYIFGSFFCECRWRHGLMTLRNVEIKNVNDTFLRTPQKRGTFFATENAEWRPITQFWRHINHANKLRGKSLCRKYSAIKNFVNNQITPHYIKLLGPDGLPPSGMNKETILLKTKEALCKAEQLAAKNQPKHPPSFKMKPFKPSYQPCEWEIF